MSKSLKVLLINSSSRGEASVSRKLTTAFIEHLAQKITLNVQERDTDAGLPFIDEHWIDANYTPVDKRTDKQLSKLALSDTLVDELENADIIVIGAPMYNFSIPATLKAWIDLVARVGKTFRYTSDGPVGLLQNKKAYVMIATGGTPVGSTIDYASDYLRQVLGFIGITDVTFITADQLNKNPGQADRVISDLDKIVEQAQIELLNAA